MKKKTEKQQLQELLDDLPGLTLEGALKRASKVAGYADISVEKTGWSGVVSSSGDGENKIYEGRSWRAAFRRALQAAITK